VKRRYMPVADLRVTNHGIRILQRMSATGAHIHYDSDVCVLLTEPARKLSHKAVKSLRTARFIRPRDYDKALYVLTGRARELLATDPRTRERGERGERGERNTVQDREVQV
jgi:hypothetical protein